ncbi:beta-class carbonic anhydrase [Humidisolicoccus flavus]|uniref:beta-class carbonic anhydrase n=1 Tax=Humidisolicoccus flavus TaxID=3111414 RepID=UPI003255FC9A
MSDFDDLLHANEQYAETFSMHGFDGIAKAGVAMVTCMDSRIDPLAMIGLTPGDAKILRNPGGRVTPSTLIALVLGSSLLGVNRVLIVQHTRCAMAKGTEAEIKQKVGEITGTDASWLPIGAISDQAKTLHEDVQKVRSHPLIPDSVDVGGFLYDVDNGRLTQVV